VGLTGGLVAGLVGTVSVGPITSVGFAVGDCAPPVGEFCSLGDTDGLGELDPVGDGLNVDPPPAIHSPGIWNVSTGSPSSAPRM
jgi:hypothetical protein